jgi:hypothetical protein
MDLDKLEIALRPRSHWEAIDLGFALARRWFMPLCALWLTTALPVSLLLLFIADGDLIWMSLLLWWFKPAYEPLLVFWLSRAVFGERPPLKSVRRQWWRITRPQLFANLTWRRLSSNRSFYMPVALLEGLKGKERHRRISILGRRQHAGTWLTIVGIHFETILEFCFLLGIYFLVPEELRWFEGDDFFFSPGPIDEWLQLICWLAAMGIIAPFYVAGGFALYLHRRSELEGWDIEINFRRTAEKLQSTRRGPIGALLAALFGLSLFMTDPHQAHANDSLGPKESKQRIEEVLSNPLFGRMEEETYWKYVGTKAAETDEEAPGWLLRLIEVLIEVFKGFMKGIASYGEIILWGAGLFTLAYLLYHFSRNSDWMQAIHRGNSKGKRQLPSELFGLDVRPDSLPDDIGAEALRQVKAGKLRAALSLLYRGSLIRLITEHQLDIPASATEGECLKLVRHHRSTNEADYFGQLTRAWLTTAYAHLLPDARRIEQLCHDWQKVYGHAER